VCTGIISDLRVSGAFSFKSIYAAVPRPNFFFAVPRLAPPLPEQDLGPGPSRVWTKYKLRDPPTFAIDLTCDPPVAAASVGLQKPGGQSGGGVSAPGGDPAPLTPTEIQSPGTDTCPWEPFPEIIVIDE
jgi:hypothetical protein